MSDLLTSEDAQILLEEYEEIMEQLETGEVETDEVQEDLDRLLRSLRQAPGPRTLLEDTLESLRAWTEALVEEEGREPAGGGSPFSYILDDLSKLRALVEEEG